MPKVPVDFAGPSYFGGKDDQLVLCAGKGRQAFHRDAPVAHCTELTSMLAGDIHIWDRDSGALLHHIQARALGGDLTSVAWNYAVDNPFMFATGSHDGAVRIFTTPYAPSHTSDGHGGENRGRSTSRVDTASSFGADVEYRRTDSPVTIRDGDVQFGHDTSSPQNEFGTPNRNRSVVFATPEAAVDTSPG
jgi:WD40 repeat protein